MNNSVTENTIVSLITLYRSGNKTEELRSRLAIQTIKALRDSNFTVISVDGGSDATFLAEVKQLGAEIITAGTNELSTQKRESIEKAYETGKEIIVLIEPEKIDLVKSIEKTVMPILNNEADVVIPQRISLESYPTAQQYAEPLGNAFFKEIAKHNLDVWFGPRIFRRDITPYFLQAKGEDWSTIFSPILDIIKDEKKIISVPVDYTHPKEQTDSEEHDITFYRKRVEKQLLPLMNALEKHAKEIGMIK